MKIFTGTVVSKKMSKTASISVERVVQHPLYGKRMKRTTVYHVHDELDTQVGDVVRFVETKPISKTKRWKVTEVVNGKEPEKKEAKPKTTTKRKSASAKKTAARQAK